ncbi:MAG: GumC family protein [Pikeienuella sp.]|uniref:GumC family protein n=1 Tax=Pikeienuella sp. TaxID=2831957 RepID=UPI00391DEACD
MSLTNILAALKRRAWIIALFFVTIAPLGVGIAYILPPVYSANARIIVESQQIPDELAQSTVTASAQERLQFLQQILLTRQNLIAIVEKHNLYSENPHASMSNKIDALRRSVTLSDFNAGPVSRRTGPAIVGLNLTFRSNRPVVAAAVANEFVTLVLELNLRQRTERATETVAFFSAETNRLSQALVALEAEIIAFKRENADSLPEAAEFRRSQITSLENTAFNLEQELAALTSQRQEALFALDQGLIGADTAQASPQQQQINALRNTLIQQRSMLAASHPQIRALEARIAALEQEMAQVSPTTGEVLDVGMLQKRQAQRQIERLEEQIASIELRSRTVAAEIDAVRQAIERAPEVEIELKALERQFSGLQAELGNAQAKRAAAATGEKLEVNQQAERFVVLEQAQVPSRPDSPNRPIIAGAGVGASLALGIGLVVLLELMNKSIRTAADLNARVGLRPIVVVPYIHTRRERRIRLARIAAVLGVLAIGAPLLLYLIDTHYLPLELLADKVMTMSGLDKLFRLIEQRL